MTFKEFQEKIKRVYDEYPQSIKEALFSFENSTIIREIATKYKVDEASLAQEVGFVLVGAVQPNEMIERLKKRFSLDSHRAGSLFREINRYIFFPLREDLSLAYQIAKREEISPFEEKVFEEKEVSREEVEKIEKKIEKIKEGKEVKETKEKEKEVEKTPLPKGKVIDLGRKKEFFKEKEVSPEEIRKIKKETEKEKGLFPEIKIPKIISQQKVVKPIADIEKPRRFEEIPKEVKGEDELFGKIEFSGAREKKKEKKIDFAKAPEMPPDFSEIKYSAPEKIKKKKLSPLRRIISFRKEK